MTDGAGWRLEIKKYPELTNKAARRTHANWKDWWQNGRQYTEQGNPNASGGFYTQKEAKELVKYAAERGINIIPEIEMPDIVKKCWLFIRNYHAPENHILKANFV